MSWVLLKLTSSIAQSKQLHKCNHWPNPFHHRWLILAISHSSKKRLLLGKRDIYNPVRSPTITWRPIEWDDKLHIYKNDWVYNSNLKRSVRGSLRGQRVLHLPLDMWTSRAGDGYFSLKVKELQSNFPNK